jgi:hypothetical protein
MTTEALIDIPVTVDFSIAAPDVEILKQINKQDAITMDALIVLMPEYSWNQIFHAVDCLARCRKIVLRRHRFEYTLFSINFIA